MSSKILLKKDKDRLSDSFYVTFLRLPINSQNVFGRQLVSIRRPEISFEVTNTEQRDATRKDISKPTIGSGNMTFHDDEDSVILALIYQQIFRQAHKNNQNKQTKDDTSFDIHIDLLNSNDQITGEMTLIRCHITNVTFDELTYQSSEVGKISVDFDVENIDIKINKDHVGMVEMIPATGQFTTQPKPSHEGVNTFDH